MEEEGATAFGQQTLKRAILQATQPGGFGREKAGGFGREKPGGFKRLSCVLEFRCDFEFRAA